MFGQLIEAILAEAAQKDDEQKWKAGAFKRRLQYMRAWPGEIRRERQAQSDAEFAQALRKSLKKEK